jgi:hypothetical protein
MMTTKAGRAFDGDPYDIPNRQRRHDYIVAIEAEAFAQGYEQAKADAIAAVEGLRATKSSSLHDVGAVWQAVAAAIRDLKP